MALFTYDILIVIATYFQKIKNLIFSQHPKIDEEGFHTLLEGVSNQLPSSKTI